MTDHYKVDVTIEAPEDLSKGAILRAVRRSLHNEDTDIRPVKAHHAIQIKR